MPDDFIGIVADEMAGAILDTAIDIGKPLTRAAAKRAGAAIAGGFFTPKKGTPAYLDFIQERHPQTPTAPAIAPTKDVKSYLKKLLKPMFKSGRSRGTFKKRRYKRRRFRKRRRKYKRKYKRRYRTRY